MFKKIVIITLILGFFISVNLFAGPWVEVDADDDINWTVEYSDGLGTTNGMGYQVLNACGHENQTATLYVNENQVDYGTVPNYENGWLHLEVPFGTRDDDEPITD